MFKYLDIQNEIKRRALRNQAGTAYDTAVKNVVNSSLFRISREATWRMMRRTSFFDTVTSYVTGTTSANATSESTSVTITGAALLTDDVHTNRIIKMSGSSNYYQIRTITGVTSLTIDKKWSASTTTNMTYEIYPQEEYNLPIQAGHRMFLWHEDYGYPYPLEYITDNDFFSRGYDRWEKGTPERYRMWEENMVIQQPKQAGTLSVFSNALADSSLTVTVFGVSGGYPAYETIILNSGAGTTASAGSVSFSSVERVVKNASSSGRIGVYADANTSTTVAVLPIGDTTGGILYKKVKLHPLPTRVFPVNVYYYKDPYRLVNDNDIHELGQEFDEAIILLSVAKIKAESGQQEASNYYGMYQDELRNLRKTNMDKIDWYPTLQSPYGTRGHGVHPYLSYRQIGSAYGRRSWR